MSKFLFAGGKYGVVNEECGDRPPRHAYILPFKLDPFVVGTIVRKDRVLLSHAGLNAHEREGVAVGHAGRKPDTVREVGT